MTTRLAAALWLLLTLALAAATPARAQTAPGRAACPPPVTAVPDAAAPARDRGLLWKATRDGRTVWLLGTLHVGKPQWKRLGPQVSQALRSSDVLALEIDPTDPMLLQAMAELRHPANLPPAVQQRLDQAFERACLATEALAALHPVLQATTLTMMEARWLGMDPAWAQEQLLVAQARAWGRRVVALESAQVQIKALVPDDEAEAVQLLDQSLAQLEDRSARRVLEKLVQAWEKGDHAALEDYERWCECAATDADRAFLRQLNDERNTGLANGIEAQHQAGHRVLAAVGALHMTGPQSLPRLLAQRGFKVERVPLR